ncbi:MAG: RuBisCO large subunit C-terminal-like domain-containing protein [Planctomycetota bacterium]|nr:RuBisCO large subunit C-terminal-like domain-containing protein [Planctomycetota bacterium]
MSRILATYRVFAPELEVAAIARAIAVEQTVEVPDALIDERIEREIVADVERVTRVGKESSDVVLGFDAELACGHLNQLLNLVAGNVMLRPDTRLVDLALPDDFLAAFPGPNHGVDGLRALTGVTGRPLLATALKPRGRSVEHFARVAAAFASGGGDLVKDDHNLVDHDLAGFRARVRACQAAVVDANARTGGACLYIPHVMVPADRLDEALAIVLDAEVSGVMVAPLLYGLDTVRSLAARTGLLVMSHPTFTGAYVAGARHGIDKGLLMGTLFRLAGIDISVFTNHGGRFGFTRASCLRVAERLRRPLGALAAGWPSPAGGMTFDRIGELIEEYGIDTVLLIGGALLAHGADVTAATHEYRAAIESLCEPPLQ